MPGSPPPDRPAACLPSVALGCCQRAQSGPGRRRKLCVFAAWLEAEQRPGCLGFGRFAQLSTAQAGVVGGGGTAGCLTCRQFLHRAVRCCSSGGTGGVEAENAVRPGLAPLASQVRARTGLSTSGCQGPQTRVQAPAAFPLEPPPRPPPASTFHFSRLPVAVSPVRRQRQICVCSCALLALRSVAL